MFAFTINVDLDEAKKDAEKKDSAETKDSEKAQQKESNKDES